MKYLILIMRLSAILLTVILALPITLICFPTLPKKYWANIVRCWSKIILWEIGVKLEIIGDIDKNYLQYNNMLIANHISWFDVFIIYTIHFVSFVGRIEMKSWPLFNILLKSTNTIFIDRSKKRDLLNVTNIVSNALKNGATIGLFPEGKTSNGKQVLAFKSSLLESVIIAKSKITPFVILYYKKDGTPAYEVTYEGDITLWQTIKSSLLLNGITAKIIALPTVNASDFASREEITKYLFKQISNEYNKGLICQTLTPANKLMI